MKSEKLKISCGQNGYPEEVIISGIKKKFSNFHISKRFGPEKCPVYIKLETFSLNMKTNKINSQQSLWINVGKNNFLFNKDVAFFFKGHFACSSAKLYCIQILVPL